MFVFGNVLIGAGQVLNYVLWTYTLVLIGRAVVSWVDANPRNGIVRFLYMATEPPLRAIRRLLPASLRNFPLDIAFLVLFGLVIFAEYAVALTLIEAGYRMKGPRLY
jgi:YggT family protein